MNVEYIMDSLASRTISNRSIVWHESEMNLDGSVTWEYNPFKENETEYLPHIRNYELCRLTYNKQDGTYTFFYRTVFHQVYDNSFEVEETFPLCNYHAINLHQAIVRK